MAYSDHILAESSILSYWPLTESVGAGTALDAAPTSVVNGTPNAGVTFGATGLLLEAGTSATFDGTSGGISMGSNYVFTGTTNFSVECWVRTPASFDGGQHMIVSAERNDSVTGDRYGWHLVILPTTNHFGAGRWHVTNLVVDAEYATTLTVSTVYHLVMTYDGTNTRLYVNAGTATVGASDTSSVAATPNAPQPNFGIGGFDANTFYWYAGQVGHVAVYNAVLTPTQILDHYTAGTTTGVTPQKARPSSDITDGNWLNEASSATNLYASIDEADTPTDSDYIQSGSAPSSDLVEVGLGSITDPVSSSGHVLRYRTRLDQVAGGAISLVTELRQGASALSTPVSDTISLTTITETTNTVTLSGAQADAITDYTTLRFRSTATQAAAATPTLVAVGVGDFTATNNQSFTPALPTGWADGDVHVLIIQRNDNTTATSITGWTQISALSGNNTVNHRSEVWWRRAVAGDTAPTVTMGSSTPARGGIIFGVRNSADPFNQSSRSANASSTTVASASITTPTVATLGVFAYAYMDNPTAATTPSGGWAAFATGNNTLQLSSVGNDLGFGVSTQTFTASTSYGTPSTVTSGAAANVSEGFLLAFGPVTNASKARITWAELEAPVAPGGGGGARPFGRLLHVGT